MKIKVFTSIEVHEYECARVQISKAQDMAMLTGIKGLPLGEKDHKRIDSPTFIIIEE